MNVRLKDTEGIFASLYITFQFNECAIKSQKTMPGCLLIRDFNSMNVRLKASWADITGKPTSHFNSMNVRLKAKNAVGDLMETLFQFNECAIKSLVVDVNDYRQLISIQ